MGRVVHGFPITPQFQREVVTCCLSKYCLSHGLTVQSWTLKENKQQKSSNSDVTEVQQVLCHKEIGCFAQVVVV